ncbi:hypothetical protein CHISP_1017 [Chitinispirillum alkaliphilum]|nr:hypothetical protein CHISP_1017 [Chitinispirillum alkaliphilum]
MDRKNSFRKALIAFLKLTVTIVIILYLIRKLGWEQIQATLTGADVTWIGAGLVIFLLSGWLGVVQWRILLANRGIPLPFTRAFKLYFTGMFFNNFIMGGIVGDAVKVASIRSRDGKGMAGFAATFLDRFAGLWAMCGFAMVGSLILLNKGALDQNGIGNAVIALFATFVLFAGIMLFLILKPLQRIFFRVIEKFSFLEKFRIKEIVSEVLLEVQDFKLICNVSALSVCIQFLRIAVHAFAAGALGLLTSGNFHYFFIFVPVIAMLMTIPLPFGAREAFGGTLFALAGFPLEAAFVMGFLASLIGIAASMLGGLFFITDRFYTPGR